MTDILQLDRLPAVLKQFGTGKTQFYDDLKDGLVTPPVRQGRRCVAWPRNEIQTLIAARIAGADRSQQQQLVKVLIAQRAQLMPTISPSPTAPALSAI